MSILFKLKYDLYLTEERKKTYQLSDSNRCKKCSKVDFSGHFILCTKSKIKNICSKLIKYSKDRDEILTAEKLIHMDIQFNAEEVFAIGWCMATIADFHFMSRKD